MADVLAVRDEYRAQTWAMLIQECNNSGLTKRAFCQQRGISEKSFYYWLRKLRSQMAEAFYGVPEELKTECRKRLPGALQEVLIRFDSAICK